MFSDRIFEYTSDGIKSIFGWDGKAGAGTWIPRYEHFKDMPVLVLPEINSSEPDAKVRVGKIIDASYQNGRHGYRIQQDDLIPDFKVTELKANAKRFGISEAFEFYRTHWSVKEVDLYKTLASFARVSSSESDAVIMNSLAPVCPVSGHWLKMCGQGSYANVYSYEDPTYGSRYALKRAKKELSPRDIERFGREFELMRRMDHPNIVRVYRFDPTAVEYTMEYCGDTLGSYIARRNGDLTDAKRKELAEQVLLGLSYLHLNSLLHRDLSLNNILVREYASGQVLIKLSDFGLAKDLSVEYTQTRTDVRGTIIDPQLESFKEYSMCHEVYAVGYILNFIFTGRKNLSTNGPYAEIIEKCVSRQIQSRYQSVDDILIDLRLIFSTLA